MKTLSAAFLPRSAAVVAALAACVVSMPPATAALTIGNNPLYLVSGKANVLIVLDNSNSMDEDATGKAVGSFSADSKSEIARGVIRSLTDNQLGRVNMGLMAYRQGTPSGSYLHNSQYDVSYDPANYDASFSGDRASRTKKYRIPNPTSAGNHIHFNVALPFYASSNQGTAFCYSPSARPFADTSVDSYRCFSTKTGTNDTTLTSLGSGGSPTTAERNQGYGGSLIYSGPFNPTDSDYAQGISDFGKQMTWTYVGRTWNRNDAPGRGYLHVPIGDLTATQASSIKAKLQCNVPNGSAPCTGDTTKSIFNAGLTPIEGTLLTAKDYFGGGWRTSAEGYTSSCYPLPTSCGKDYVILLTDGLPSTDKSGNAISNPTNALNAAAAAAGSLKAAGVETYVIGFALPYGTNPRSLDTIAASGGTTSAYDATDTASLEAAFKAIFDDIERKSSAFGGLSQNTTAITANSRVYQGRFNSTDWSGELVSIRPAEDGTLTPVWSTRETGRIPAPDARKVFTLKPGAGGVAFKTYADLDATQQGQLSATNCSASLTGSACGQARIDWLRGDRSREQNNGGPLRQRGVILGDIISSSPHYAADTNTVYVGANDGMLHAFDAATGNERFAYLPNAVMDRVAALTAPNYSHQYYVDGEIAVSTAAETGSKRILVGSLGRGGRALYALDVTDPANFGASKVLWEYTSDDLGLVFGTPVIARLNNGKAAVIVGNGYNSGNERAVLLIIDLETGALIRSIDTQAGSASASNGLATPRGWDANGDGKVDLVYAGDRLGNLWKFDLSSATAANWGSAFSANSKPAPLFVAQEGNNRQPITGGIELGLDGRLGSPTFGKLFVFFGTGQYIVSGDVASNGTQSWYGLIDGGAQIAGRSELRQRSIAVSTTLNGNSVRAFSAATTGDMNGRKGWYVDWLTPSGGATGERVISTPRFVGSVVWVSSIVPSTNTCQPGGTGYVNAIDPFTGASLAKPFLDGNTDGVVSTQDSVANPNGNGTLVIGSLSLNNGLTGEAVMMGKRLLASGSSGEVKTVGAANPLRSGRIAWREIVRP